MTRVPIPPDLPWFDGHFPGRPVLPGVAQLVLLDELLGAGGRRAAGFVRLRFRKEVLPGQEIDIEIRDDAGPGLARFSVRRAGEIACDGLVRVTSAGDPPPPPSGEVQPPAPDPSLPPIEMLVPHRGAMRFVEAVVASSPEATTALACVPEASPFARDGCAPVVLALEIAAQAAAAGEALARSRDAGGAAPREGRLVGASDVALIARGIPIGRRLVASIVLAQSAPPMAVYEAVIAESGRILATGRVSTYLV